MFAAPGIPKKPSGQRRLLRLPGFFVRATVLFFPAFVLLAAGVLSPGKAGAEEAVHIVAFGDSLTAGYGLAPEDALPAVLEEALKAKGYDVRVTNSGVSGETTAGGLARLEWSLPEDADALILGLGGNDALRGIRPQASEAALNEMLTILDSRDLPVLLAGMMAPRNLGPDYQRRFDSIYPRLADKHGVVFYPFILDGVAADPALNQPDGIHPNRQGVDIIVQRMLPFVEELIEQVRAD